MREGGWRGSGKKRGGGDKGHTSSASTRGSCQLPGQRAAAPTLTPAAQRPAGPRSILRLQSAPLPRMRAHIPPALPDSRAHRDPQRRARRTKAPQRSTHTCACSRVHTSRPLGDHAAPAAGHTAHPPLAPTASPRLHADAWGRLGGGTRGRMTPGGAHAWKVGARPAGLPLRAHAQESCPHFLPAPTRWPSALRTHCWPRCGGGGGLGPDSYAASPVPAGPRRRRRWRRRRQGRSGRPPGLGRPLPPPEDPLLQRLTPPAPRLPPCRALAAGTAPAHPTPAAPHLRRPRPPVPAGAEWWVAGDPERGRRRVRPGISDWSPSTVPPASQCGQRLDPGRPGHQSDHLSGKAPQ